MANTRAALHNIWNRHYKHKIINKLYYNFCWHHIAIGHGDGVAAAIRHSSFVLKIRIFLAAMPYLRDICLSRNLVFPYHLKLARRTT